TVPFLFNLLSYYGIHHPAVFKRIRQTVLHFKVNAELHELWVIADQAQFKLREGFRNWLGPNQTVAVDLETGEEYRWKDVIAFEPEIDEADKKRIREGIVTSPLLREAVFLFSGGTMVTLNNILPHGVWVSKLFETPTRSVFRVSIQTRFQGAFDINLKINKCLPRDNMMEEFGWLIAAGAQIENTKIVDDFGGYWEEHEIWTEEFVSGDNIEKLILREIKKRVPEEELKAHHLWLFFVWNAASVYYSFWKMTGYNYQIENPSPAAIIVPAHDYQTGSRLISIEARIQSKELAEFIINFKNHFISYCESKFDFKQLDTIWNFVFAGIIEVEGTEHGIEILQKLKADINNYDPDKVLQTELDIFIAHIESEGFEPQQLYFAVRRFHRWYQINYDAALGAQAEMLYELYETYHMYKLEEKQPETRTQFFLGTAFFDSDEKIRKELKEIIIKQRNNKIGKEELLRHIANIQNEFELSEKEKFFLTRLSFPHLKPTDSATLLKTISESAMAANLVVHMHDDDGNTYMIRNPISPKEISKLHQLFIETNLIVNFKPEHHFLVALSERGYIIGGLYYYISSEEMVHMEKIVVSNRYRRKGISEGLMNELFNRLRDEHIKYITTGFFRPEYFYRFNFKVERKYSGLVKEL
ncbi:MAG: GNAT family N-acetyltransferase, partial [Ignavibacteriaceae bacterium]|nr:GNAT family N-acetyltransferase [Ignavibacteriaceae bacterium]